ncbi:MAG TPA: hypothetical protein VIM14_06270, partial [Polyangia bacterium]
IDAVMRSGLVIGAGVGGRRGVALSGHLAYQIPISAHWSLGPGVRASRGWWKTDSCSTLSCTHDFIIIEASLRYQGSSGFVFEFGLPIVAWIPTLQNGDTTERLRAYSIATPEAALVESLLFGFAY